MSSRRVTVPALALSVLLSAPAAHAQWAQPAVDTLTRTGTTKYTALQSLAIDEQGFVHVAWRSFTYGPTEARVWYATNRPGHVWSVPASVGDSFSSAPALAVSPAGEPFVSFEQLAAESAGVFVAYRSGGAWHKDRLTTGTSLDGATTIAADANGHLHVTWITSDGSGQPRLAYAFGSIGSWDIQVLSDVVNPMTAFLAVSGDGRAHVVCRGQLAPEFHVFHAWNDAPGGHLWTTERIVTENFADLTSSLAIDGAGTLHLAVGGLVGSDITDHRRVFYLVQRTGEAWQPAELVAVDAYIPSIDVTAGGQPRILWTESDPTLPVRATGRLFVSHPNAVGGWESDLVAGDDYFQPSFRLDAQGFGHIAAGTGGNSFVYDIHHMRSSAAVVSVGGPEGRGAVLLLPNAPNPFGASTTIAFQLGRDVPVVLSVHDLSGREVARFAWSRMPPGRHAVEWSAPGLPSGVYLCTLRAGPFRDARKLLVVR
jgi:hypothetical protein